MSHPSRVVWDQVPPHVRAALALRERPKPGDTAIVDAAPGERWYFRRSAHGWNHVSTDRDSSNDKVAPDLTPEQRAEALTQVEKVERTMRKVLDGMPPPERALDDARRSSADEDSIMGKVVQQIAQKIVDSEILSWCRRLHQAMDDKGWHLTESVMDTARIVARVEGEVGYFKPGRAFATPLSTYAPFLDLRELR